ncbi:LLM class flavin-dependent oxidoreductase, partial [Paraburkholderia sp. Se-20369]|nr:LLM class flavin-dependent oxidoreductase [Paraburkholderia sp. Se-20369]
GAVERLAEPGFRAFGVAMRLDLDARPDAPATALPLGYATGRHALLRVLQDMRAAGTHHVSLNLGSNRPVRDVLEEIAAHVLPSFHEDA